jgi:ABC-type amino acid transport substrate-binding protein
MLAAFIAFLMTVGLVLSGCSSVNDSNQLGLVNPGKLTVGCVAGPNLTGNQTDQDPSGTSNQSDQDPSGTSNQSDKNLSGLYYLTDGKPDGFYYQLMAEIAHDMGLELVFREPEEIDDNALNAAFRNKDVIVNYPALKVNDELAFGFIPNYDLNYACAVASTSTFTSISDLNGKKIGVDSGSECASWVKEHISYASVQSYQSIDAGLDALKAGTIDAFIGFELAINQKLATEYHSLMIIECLGPIEQYGMITSEGNSALETAVSESLQRMIDNGRYTEIYYKCFGFAPTIHGWRDGAATSVLGNNPNENASIYETDHDLPSVDVIASDVSDTDAISSLIIDDLTSRYILSANRVLTSVQIVITTKGDDTWALVYPFIEPLEGQQCFEVYAVTGSIGSRGLIQTYYAWPPISPGFSVDIFQYEDKFLVCGGVTDSHLQPADNQVIDISDRSYLLVSSQTETIRVPVASTEWLCGFICVLDSELVDVVLYDSHDQVLLVLSERPNELHVSIH